jgi:hypothetical protein
VRLDWQTARVGPEPNGTFFPFLIQDFTERALRAFPTGKPTTSAFQGVAKVVIAVRDLDGAVSRFRQAYGLPAPLHQADPGFQARLASFDGTPVVLAGPSSAQSWLNERLRSLARDHAPFFLPRQTAPRFTPPARPGGSAWKFPGSTPKNSAGAWAGNEGAVSGQREPEDTVADR